MKLKNKILTFLSLILIFFWIFNQNALAFNRAANELKSDIDINLTPEIPNPNEYAILDISSYQISLDAADVKFFLNDQLIESGIGKKKFVFKIPETQNQQVELKVWVNSYNGKFVEKKKKLNLASVDLQYEVTNAFKPAFYQGKKLATSNSGVKIYAFPDFKMKNGAILPPETLIYNWSVDGRKLTNKSGLGKRFLFLTETRPYPWRTKIDLVVTDLAKKRKAYRSIFIEPENPRIDFYYSEDSSLPFSYKNIVKNGQVEGNTISTIEFYAIPWFFENLENNEIDWKIQNNPVYLLEDKDKTVLKIVRNVNNALGDFQVSLRVKNPFKKFQRSQNSFRFKPSEDLINLYRTIYQNSNEENKNRESGEGESENTFDFSFLTF